MNDPLKESNELPSLYSLSAIGLATFLGSVLAGGYMIMSNYLVLGQKQTAKYVAYATAAIILIWIAVSMQVVSAGITTMIAINMGQVILALIVAHKLQGPMFSSYEEMGGQYQPMWKSLVVALASSLVFTFLGTLLIVVLGSTQ
jgi:hypothetical protein